VDYAPDAILVHSNGIFLYANSAAMRLFGAASMEQLVGQPVISIVHPDYREIVSKRIQQLSESENPNGILEQKMMRFDGNTIDVEAVGIRISYQGKQAFQVIIRDITEKKLIQEALKEKVSLLEAALSKVKHLEGIIPICSYCKKIRDDKASWQQLESYITEHSEALFSHGTCPECAPKVNSEYMKELEKISPK
jgi:PAS domain S-box-containing protein